MHPLRRPDGGIGRRVGLKHQWGNTRAGSTPALGTKQGANHFFFKWLAFLLFEIWRLFGDLFERLPNLKSIDNDQSKVFSHLCMSPILKICLPL